MRASGCRVTMNEMFNKILCVCDSSSSESLNSLVRPPPSIRHQYAYLTFAVTVASSLLEFVDNRANVTRTAWPSLLGLGLFYYSSAPGSPITVGIAMQRCSNQMKNCTNGKRFLACVTACGPILSLQQTNNYTPPS